MDKYQLVLASGDQPVNNGEKNTPQKDEVTETETSGQISIGMASGDQPVNNGEKNTPQKDEYKHADKTVETTSKINQ